MEDTRGERDTVAVRVRVRVEGGVTVTVGVMEGDREPDGEGEGEGLNELEALLDLTTMVAKEVWEGVELSVVAWEREADVVSVLKGVGDPVRDTLTVAQVEGVEEIDRVRPGEEVVDGVAVGLRVNEGEEEGVGEANEVPLILELDDPVPVLELVLLSVGVENEVRDVEGVLDGLLLEEVV